MYAYLRACVPHLVPHSVSSTHCTPVALTTHPSRPLPRAAHHHHHLSSHATQSQAAGGQAAVQKDDSHFPIVSTVLVSCIQLSALLFPSHMISTVVSKRFVNSHEFLDIENEAAGQPRQPKMFAGNESNRATLQAGDQNPAANTHSPPPPLGRVTCASSVSSIQLPHSFSLA